MSSLSENNQQPVNTPTKALAGLSIAIPETRQLDVLAKMLTQQGARPVRCPLVAIHDSPDTAAVEAWLARFNAEQMDDLILMTGEGLRRLLGFAARADCRDTFISQLGKVKKLTRGPKPGTALAEVGLKTDQRAVAPTTDGVIASLAAMDLHGRAVGVQLYGQEPNRKLTEYLQSRGARVDTVAPYVYASEVDEQKVQELIRSLLARDLEAICFTSQSQVKRLLKVAGAMQARDELVRTLDDIMVVAVGPVVSEALVSAGIKVDVMPEGAYFMKPMVRALAQRWRTSAEPDLRL
jgi:uroporphyrinogen-III synthase